jgi:hypothetical protein
MPPVPDYSQDRLGSLFEASVSVLTPQEDLMFPKYRHTPIFDAERKRCPVCRRAVYSLADVHPQCALKRAIALESGSKKEAAYNAGSASFALSTDAC